MLHIRPDTVVTLPSLKYETEFNNLQSHSQIHTKYDSGKLTRAVLKLCVRTRLKQTVKAGTISNWLRII